jgi:copper chaperone CopZ
MKTTVHSEDIECSGCISSIEKALLELGGVSSVIGNPETKMVTVEHDDLMSIDELLKRMEDAGFESKVVP